MPRKRTSHNVTLKDLIDARYLEVDEVLTCTYKGTSYTASLNADGSVEYAGDTVSPNKWADTIKANQANSWEAITARGEKLKDIRKRYEDGIEPSQEIQPAIIKPEPVQGAPQNGARPADAESLQSELDSLRSRVVSQRSVIANLNTKIDSLSVASSEDDTEDDSTGDLREDVAQLTPSEFQELVRQYVEDKGFVNAEITVVLKMSI